MKRTVQQFVTARLVAVCVGVAALGSVYSPTTALAAVLAGPRGSVTGVVRDAEGMPQIGVVVELLRKDSTLAARVFTNGKGVYAIPSVPPGQYALKALGASFIPTLKQNLHIQANTVVNLTMNSLYDLMQWVPQAPKTRSRNDDDWAWTLRSAEGRPLLRWLEDGSPILVWDGTGETSGTAVGSSKARVQASAGGKRFEHGSEQVSMAMQRDTSARRRMVMSADLSPDAAGLMEAMFGFRQQMSASVIRSGSMQTLAAVLVDPQAGAGGRQGLQAASLRSWESLQLLNDLQAEAGSEQVLARLGDGSPTGSVVMAALPFASLKLRHGSTELQYQVATSRHADPEADQAEAGAWLPILSEREGQLVIEHGLHQELGWSTSAGPAEMRMVIYADSIENPMLESSGRLTAADEAGQWMLSDRASGLLRTAGQGYSTTGVLASVESRLPGHNRVRLSYASGDAVVMHASNRPEDLSLILKGAHARRAQMYSLVLSGTVEGTGTRWRASYRWQPDSTVTEVAPFAVNASEPYLNIYIRQPIWTNRQGPGSVEAQVDMRNLLAEGYQPFITSDGSHLYFAQAQQSVRGGLAFTF